MNIASWLEAHRRSVLLLFTILAIGGMASIELLPVGLFPRASFPRVVVSAEAGDRPADRMVIEVTRPLEDAVRSVPGVRNVRSRSSRGGCDISVDFRWGLDMVAATLQVEAVIARVLPLLPAGTSFEVRRMDPTVFPVIGLSLTSKSATRSLVALRDTALYDLKPLLSAVDGVSSVKVLGGRSAEVQILVSPLRLEATGLTLEDVVSTVSASNVVEAVGRLEDGEKLLLVLSDSPLRASTQIADLILRDAAAGVVRLRDVASVQSATAPEWTRITADGSDAVLLNVYQQPDGNTPQISRDVAARLQEFRSRAPSDAVVGVWYDQSEIIDASSTSTRDAVLIGIVLAVIVLRLALRSWRVTLVASVAVPLVLATTLLLLEALSMTLNIMTLGGMAAAVGLVIDDGIVMVEHVLRRVREEPTAERRATAIAAGREMIAPLTGSSAATIIIFAPLAYLSGVSGAFFKPLAVTMAATLVVSWLFSMLALPLLCALVLRPEDAASEDVGPVFRRVLERYERALRGLLARPLLVLLPVGIVVVLGAIGYRFVGTGFMPVMDEGGFVLDYRAPPGTSLSETDRQLRELERVLTSVPEILAYSRRTGLSLGGHITESNEGDFFVRLRPPPRRSTEAVIDDVRDQVNARVPGLQIELAQLIEDLIGDLTAVPQPIEVKLFGPDATPLRQAADQVAKTIGELPGVVDVKNGVVLAGDALEIQVDRERAALLGLNADQVTRFASLALQGSVVTQLQQTEKMVGIRVWTDPAGRGTPDALRHLRIQNGAGAAVPLGRVTEVAHAIGQPQITRENLSTMVAVTGRISGRDLGSVMQDVQRGMGRLSLPPGSYVRYGGLYREQRESFRALTVVLLAAAVLVFILLFYLYERPSAPVAILAVSGLAVAGVFVGLWWTGSELDISSLMGLTMVVGISAEACVFLLTQWQESSHRLPLEWALLEAGRVRFRPITMTGLAAILALLPLALGIGQGAAMLQPLAIAIVSGLIVTVPAVLIVLPVLFARLERRRNDSVTAPMPS